MTTAVTENSLPRPPAGISGKRLTGWVLAALAAIGISLSTTLWTYSRLDAVRRDSNELWRSVTEHLSVRYRAAEKLVAQGVDSRQIKMEFGERFRLAVDAFQTTSLPAEQVAAAERLEKLLAGDDFQQFTDSLPELPREANSLVAEYNRSREREKGLLESWTGWMLSLVLKFDPPRPFVIGAL